MAGIGLAYYYDVHDSGNTTYFISSANEDMGNTMILFLKETLQT